MSRKKKRSPQSNIAPTAVATALERFAPLLTAEEFRLMMEELARPMPAAFRINPLKTNAGDEQTWAKRYGWQLNSIPFCPTGFWVPETSGPISMTLEHRMGHYYIQDASSMLPAELFDFEGLEHPLVLDLAASPGGKTTHLSARMQDRGLIIANDSATDRITALRLVLQNWGNTNSAVTRFPGEKFGRWYPETFDRVLLDAPCSMQGLRSTDSHPMRPISNREQESLARRQAALLSSAIAALKVGGQVVYSTCTLAPEENEAVLDEVLRRFPGALRIEKLDERLPVPAPGLSTAYGKSFDPQVENAARLWPHRYHTSGFFAALIRKIGIVEFPREEAPDRPLSKVGQTPLSTALEREVIGVFIDRYNYDLLQTLDHFNLQLWQSPAGIFAVPNLFLTFFSGLPCQLLGLKVAEYSGNEIIPAHDWVSRFASKFSSGLYTISVDQTKPWLRGEDLSADTHLEDIVILVDDDGRCFGRGRVQAGKIKNLLPRRMI